MFAAQLLLTLVPPLAHFAILKFQWPTAVVSIPILLYCVFYSCVAIDPLEPMSEMLMGCYIFYAFRIAEIALVARHITQRWDYMEYFEFTFTFDTKATRSQRIAELRKKIEKKPNDLIAKRQLSRIVPYENLTFDYYKFLILYRLIQLAIAQLLVKFVRESRTDWNPPVFKLQDFSDWTLVRDYFFVALGALIGLDLGLSLVGHISAHVFKSDYIPAMDNPLFSTSLRDFWSLRWNTVIQRCLKRIAFEPVVSILHGKPGEKIPTWILMCGAFATFFVSACMHEWLIFVMTTIPSTFEQFVFFLLHGMLSIAETWIVSTIAKTTGYKVLDDTPWIILFIYHVFIQLWTMPLFFNPFIRDGLFFRLAMWVI